MDAKHGVDTKNGGSDEKNEGRIAANDNEELLWLCNTLEEYKEQNDAYASELSELRDKVMCYEEKEKKRKVARSSSESNKNEKENLRLMNDLEEAIVMLDTRLMEAQDSLNQKDSLLQELKEELARSLKINENLNLKILDRDGYIDRLHLNCKSLKSRNKELQQTLEQYEDDINNKQSQLIELKQYKTVLSPHRSPKNSKKSPLKGTWQQAATSSTSIVVDTSEEEAFFSVKGVQSTTNWADGGDKYTNLFARINVRRNDDRNNNDQIFLDDDFDDLVLNDNRNYGVEDDATVLKIRKSRPPLPKSNIPPTLLSRVRDITKKPFVSQLEKDKSDISDRSSPYESGSDASGTSALTARSGFSDANNKKFTRSKGMSQPLYSTTQLNAEAMLNNI